MPNDEPASASIPAPVLPGPPVAWQPLTPRGVAAFAQASLGRLLLVELIVALLAGGAVAWFLAVAWFPAVKQFIQQLPEQGTIGHQQLDLAATPAVRLAENRPFLILVMDPENQRNASQTSDVLVEFHRKNYQVCSIFGCLFFNYPKRGSLEITRAHLAPLWEAWEPTLLVATVLSIALGLLLSWSLLATIYCVLVRLLGFFKDRDLTWGRSWRLASAALLPGALMLAAGVCGYGLGVVDLIRLLLLFVLHLATGWVYLALSPLYVPHLPEVASRGTNPFVASESKTDQ
jgi:hypothetical protein